MPATIQDLHTALSHLTDANHLRLLKLASIRMGVTAYRHPQELVAEAISIAFMAAAGQGGPGWDKEEELMDYLVKLIGGIV